MQPHRQRPITNSNQQPHYRNSQHGNIHIQIAKTYIIRRVAKLRSCVVFAIGFKPFLDEACARLWTPYTFLGGSFWKAFVWSASRRYIISDSCFARSSWAQKCSFIFSPVSMYIFSFGCRKYCSRIKKSKNDPMCCRKFDFY